jgi:hypothetical protein
VAALLQRASRLDPKAAQAMALALVQAYPRRRALREALDPLLGKAS